MYFKNKRSLATGIAMSGSGFGIFVLAYLTNTLLEVYDWRGTLLITSGLFLNCAVCATFVRPLRERKTVLRRYSFRGQCRNVSSCCISGDVEKKYFEEEYFSENGKDGQCQETFSNQMVKLRALGDTDIFHQNHKSEENVECHLLVKYLSKSESYIHSTQKESQWSNDDLPPSKPRSVDDNLFYTGNCGGGVHLKNGEIFQQPARKISSRAGIKIGSDLNCGGVKEETYLSRHLNLFKDAVFVMFLIVMAFWTAQAPVITYLPDMVVSKNIPRTQASLVISGLGAANIAGRFLAGCIANRPAVHSLVLYTCALLAAGVDIALLVHCTTFATYLAYGIVLGLCSAVCVSLRTIVLIDVLGLSKLAQSFGVIAMVQGVCLIIASPISGELRDVTFSYAASFYTSACLHVAAGFICIIMLAVLKQRRGVSGTTV